MTDGVVLKQRRPILIWGIAIFLAYLVLSGIYTQYSILTDTFQIDLAYKAQFDAIQASQTSVDKVAVWLFLLLNLAGAIALFFMKKLALPIFLTHTVLGFCYSVWFYFTGQFSNLTTPEVVLMMFAFSNVINLLIAFYTWRLHQKGVLK